MELQPHAPDETLFRERLSLVLPAEIDVNRRYLVLSRNLRQRLAHGLHKHPAVAFNCKEARARHRRKRHTNENLRIVLDSKTMGEVRPLVVENEFAHAVTLEVHRA